MSTFFESGIPAAVVIGVLIVGIIYIVWVMHYNR